MPIRFNPQARRQGDDALRETPRSFPTPQTCPVLRHLSPARNMAFAGIERISILARHLQQRGEAWRVTDRLKAAMYDMGNPCLLRQKSDAWS